jgi:hypothetical protein
MATAFIFTAISQALYNKWLDANGGSVNSLPISNCRLPIEFAPPRQLRR